jgi:hypothetical protein
MYLTIAQVNQLLNMPHYTAPFTESLFKYALYRGRLNSKVYTVRFNNIQPLDEDFIFNHLYTQLQIRFPSETYFRASIKYDLLLLNRKDDTYYIWRANSNEHNFDENDEILLVHSPEHILQFCKDCTIIDIPSLDINFENSGVIVVKVLAIVFNFATTTL